MNTNLKFISFRNEYDLKELTEKGVISMTLNANNKSRKPSCFFINFFFNKKFIR